MDLKDVVKSKLKRNKLNGFVDAKEVLEGTVYQKIPEANSPALRAYKSLSNLNFDRHVEQHANLIQHEEGRRYDVEGIRNTIINGDSVEVLRALPRESIDLVVTSPPYWNVVDYDFEGQYGQGTYDKYLKELLNVWKECERLLKPNGKLCVQTPIMPISKKVINSQHTRHLKNINNDIEHSILEGTGLKRFSLYIWQKQTTEKMFGSYPYPPNIYEQNTVEFINVYVKDGEPQKLSKEVKERSKLSSEEWIDLTSQIWFIIPKDIKREEHPAPFPEELCNRLIAMYSFKKVTNGEGHYEGDVVLDPFCGVGTTCVAAKRLGRNYVGIDLSRDFCVKSVQGLQHCGFDTGRAVLLKRNGNAQLSLG